jgi:hypothetical protein
MRNCGTFLFQQMSNMLNNPEAISQAMSMITPEMMDQVSA